MDMFSAEEINLMCIYHAGSRAALRNSLATGLHGISDPEMLALFASALEKLDSITDEEFESIGFYAAGEFDGDDG